MAIDKRLQIYDEQGNLVDYDILASDVKFLPDGKDLPTKLAEMQEEIDDAGQGDGTVTGVKIGSTNYEPTDGVVDLSSPMSNKVDKETGKGLSTNDYTTEEKTKLGSLPTNPVQTISVNGGTPATPVNGNVNISVEGGEEVSVTTNQDGTVDIHVGDDTYTINLNHTHEGMAKLLKCTEATLPQTLANDTIYVQVDDATNPTEIEKIFLFGLEFTGGIADTTPKLTLPASGTTIDFDGASTKTLVVKGRNLTAALSLTVTGDFTVTANGSTVSSISASDANDGVTLTLKKGSGFSSGSLALSSTEVESRSVSVVDTYVPEIPEGFLADTAWDGSNGSGEAFSAPGTVAGFCTCPFYEIGKGSDNKIHISVKAGFIRAEGEKRFIVFRPYTFGNTNAAYGQSADPRELSFDSATNHVYRYVSATFKSSEIDNCYIYDFVAGSYLFAGKNVDTSVAPTATL